LNRKLILLNVALAGVLVYAGMAWRNEYRAAKERERKLLAAKVQPAPVGPWAPLPNQLPVMATGYADVAQKLLLHPSRNPSIPVEPPPPPPPPEPMPPLPKYHGSMNLDGEAVAILSMGNNPFQEVKAGGEIGQFKLVDVNTRDITFQWKDQQVRKTLNELLDRSAAEAVSANNTPAAIAPVPPPQIKTQVGPVGDESGFHTKACDPNDSYSVGSVVGGYRKTMSPTPFGQACSWVQVGK